jgi:hypothetical protein
MIAKYTPMAHFLNIYIHSINQIKNSPGAADPVCAAQLTSTVCRFFYSARTRFSAGGRNQRESAFYGCGCRAAGEPVALPWCVCWQAAS